MAGGLGRQGSITTMLSKRYGLRPFRDTPSVGVTFAYFEKFCREATNFFGGSVGNVTTSDVVDKIIKPVTANNLCRYADQLEDEYVKRPTYFISHAWMLPFKSMVDLLLSFVNEQSKMNPSFAEDTAFWLDIFCFNQHPLDDKLTDLDAFETIIGACQNTIMICDESGVALSRIWCIYEVWKTILSGKDKLLVLQNMNFHQMRDIFQSVAVEKALATKESDRLQILANIERTMQLSDLNAQVSSALLESSVAQTAMTTQNLRTFGKLQMHSGNYIRAEANLKQSLERFQQAEKEWKHPKAASLDEALNEYRVKGDLADGYHDLAQVYYCMHSYDRAEQLHRSALHVREVTFGEGHYITTYSQNNLADVLVHQGKLEQARELYEAALTTRIARLGENHRLVAQTLGSLALLCLKEAENLPPTAEGEQLRAAKLMQAEVAARQALGMIVQDEGSDSVAASFHQESLALVVLRAGDLHEADTLLQAALETRTVRLPPKNPSHPLLAHSHMQVGELRAAQGRHGDALACFVEAQRTLHAALSRRVSIPSDYPPLAWLQGALRRASQFEGQPFDTSPRARAGRTIAFLTDVEGNFEYLERYVELSSALRWKDAAHTELQLEEGWEFVFGGDVCDKGTGDLRIIRALVRLKERFPDRVVLILGNRDVNKLRLATELTAEAIADDAVVNDESYPYWVPAEKRVTYRRFLDRLGGLEHNTLPNRLRWILEHTMGAAGAFERRRQELAILRGSHLAEVSDDAVVESYQSMVAVDHQDALLLKYLKYGKLAQLCGATLFTHGGVTHLNMGAVPARHTLPIRSVDEWVDALNSWAKLELERFCQAPRGRGPGCLRDRPAEALMDYVLPGGAGGKSVIISSYIVDANVEPISQPVANFLKESGITSVVCGHVPHGDCPYVIRSHGIRIISADTSYSKAKDIPGGLGDRGYAVGDVHLEPCGTARILGRFADGSEYSYSVANLLCSEVPGQDGDGGPSRAWGQSDPYVGRRLQDGRWIKAPVKGSGAQQDYMLVSGTGFHIDTTYMSAADLQLAESRNEISSIW